MNGGELKTIAETGPINFYGTKDAFGDLSNFASGYPIKLKGKM